MTPEQRSRPAGNGPANNAEEQAQSTAPDLVALSPEKFDLVMVGYLAGLLEGIPRGRQLEAAEMAAQWRNVARHVRAMANIEPRDPEADAAAKARRDARWSA